MLAPRISYFYHLFFGMCAAAAAVAVAANVLLLLFLSYVICFFFRVAKPLSLLVFSSRVCTHTYTHTRCLFGLSFSFVTLHLFSIILNSALLTRTPFSATVRHICARSEILCEMVKLQLRIGHYEYYEYYRRCHLHLYQFLRQIQKPIGIHTYILLPDLMNNAEPDVIPKYSHQSKCTKEYDYSHAHKNNILFCLFVLNLES